jgi:hypothetical protein
VIIEIWFAVISLKIHNESSLLSVCAGEELLRQGVGISGAGLEAGEAWQCRRRCVH